MEAVFQEKINELTDELKKCHGSDIYAKLLRTFYVIEVICEKSKLDINYPKELNYELIKHDVDCFDRDMQRNGNATFLSMFKYNLVFSSMYQQLAEEHMKYFGKCNVTPIDIRKSIDMVYEFFKQYDTAIFDHYVELINSGRFIITNRTKYGSTIEGSHIIRPYSFVNLEGTISDSVTIAHETIHNYLFDKQRFLKEKDNNRRKINNVDEVYPSFIELAFLEYIKKYDYLLDDIAFYERISDSTIIHFLKQFHDNLINDDYYDYKTNESYAYGKVLAYHFYNMYLKDRERAKENILNFSLRSHEMDKMQLLNSYGLISDKLLDYKVLTRHMRKHNEYK